MISRALKPSRSSSFFLIGQRGTGKSTFLRGAFSADDAIWIDLLDADTESRLSRRPMALGDQLEAIRLTEPTRRWVVIDEV